MTFEETVHDAIPNSIGGDFALFTAPSGMLDNSRLYSLTRLMFAWIVDPLWFLHHSQINRLFWLWQSRDLPNRMNLDSLSETGGNLRDGLNMPMPMKSLAAELRARDMLGTESGLLCYKYV